MQEKCIRHIPIVDDDNELVGLVSQRDILSSTESSLHNSSDEKREFLERSHCVSEIMTKQLSILDKGDSLRAAALHLQNHKHGCLPILENNKLCGIITDTDFVDVAINLMEQLEQQVMEEPFEESSDDY